MPYRCCSRPARRRARPAESAVKTLEAEEPDGARVALCVVRLHHTREEDLGGLQFCGGRRWSLLEELKKAG